MPDEKSIQRWAFYLAPPSKLGSQKEDNGGWVRYEDHLDALGEAETNGALAFLRMQERRTEAEEKLQALQEGLEAEVEHWRKAEENAATASRRTRNIEGNEKDAYAYAAVHCNCAVAADRMQRLLDLREDTEKLKQSAGEGP